MGRAETWKFCCRRTKSERANERLKIKLWDAAITKRTQERYFMGLHHLMPILSSLDSQSQLDDAVSDWVQECWATGESIHIVNDGLCGLHHYEPWTKGLVPTAWKLFKTWRKIEAPNRAPSLTAAIVHAWALYAIDHHNIVFAAMLLLGFFGLLRTGEVLKLTPSDILVGRSNLLLSLRDTKTGLRNAAQETVNIDDPLSLEVVRAMVNLKREQQLSKVPIWTRSAQAFRNEFRHHCKVFDMEGHLFRPYSMRRGGATHLFQLSGSMEMALLKGRWSSSKVAKIYLMDGLSYLPGMTFTPKAKSMLAEWSPVNQL